MLIDLIEESVKDTCSLFIKGYSYSKESIYDDKFHLDRAAEWLLRSIRYGRGGSSSHYNLLTSSWSLPFPETTGYIIPTLYNYYKFSNKKIYSLFAEKAATWLSEVQLANGGCMGGHFSVNKGNESAIIFNTGQNIFGFNRAYKETNKTHYLNCSIKAGNLLIKSTSSEGIWNKYLYNSIPHTYNSRCCWALLELFELTGNEIYRDIAIKNLDWILEQQLSNGWFQYCNFKEKDYPNTHGIAYTLRGLLESYVLTGDERLLKSSEITAWKLLEIYNEKNFLPTFWNNTWHPLNKFPGTMKYFRKDKCIFTCLTGNVQLSIVWMKLYKLTHKKEYLSSALDILNYVQKSQNLESSNPGVNGAIKGSYPIYGDYAGFSFPNWSTKFFVDALLIKINSKSIF